MLKRLSGLCEGTKYQLKRNLYRQVSVSRRRSVINHRNGKCNVSVLIRKRGETWKSQISKFNTKSKRLKSSDLYTNLNSTPFGCNHSLDIFVWKPVSVFSVSINKEILEDVKNLKIYMDFRRIV